MPDYLTPDHQFINDTGDRKAFEPSSVGHAFLRWNMPNCAFIAGAKRATDKQHLYAVGERCEKTLVLLNDRRQSQKIAWQIALLKGENVLAKKSGRERVDPGAQARVSVAFDLPKTAGDYQIRATFTFADDVVQNDTFALRVVPPVAALAPATAVTLYDTKGITDSAFSAVENPVHDVSAGAGLESRGGRGDRS